MNKRMTLVALLLGFGLIFVGASSYAQTDAWDTLYGGMEPYAPVSMTANTNPMTESTNLVSSAEWENLSPGGSYAVESGEGSYPAMGWSTFEAGWLIGHSVFSPTEDYMGQISDLIIDQANDRIALVILSDIPGLGAERVAVPYSCLSRDGEDTFHFSFGDRPLVGANISPYSLYLYNFTMFPAGSDMYGFSAAIHPDWVATLYSHYGQVPYWTESGERPLAEADLYRYSQLRGFEVQVENGRNVARIDDLVIDASGGHIAFVGLIGVEGRPSDALVAVPFSFLSSKGGASFALSIGSDKLAAAPAISGYYEVNRDRARAEDTFRYFGVQPYWTE